MGRVLRVVEDGLHGGLTSGIFCNRVPGVRIAVEAWEVATGDLDPDLMSLFEDIAGGRGST